jgi:predicted ABC-type ATPase
MNHIKNQALIDTIQLNYHNIPLAVFLIGANGSGKSTLRNYLNLTDIQTNIDPDVLNRIYKTRFPETYLIESAKQALTMYKQGIDSGVNICIESTLAGHGTPARIIQAKKLGYYTVAYFVGLNNVELNLERIRQRVAEGGHNIPEASIRKRFTESIKNTIKIKDYFDKLYIIDNSHDSYSLQISKSGTNLTHHLSDIELWVNDFAQKLK